MIAVAIPRCEASEIDGEWLASVWQIGRVESFCLESC